MPTDIISGLPPAKYADIAIEEEKSRRGEAETKERAKARRQQLFMEGSKTTKTWIWFVGIALIVLFVISPAALGFLQILSEIPEWLMYAGIGMFILIFLLRRRR